MYVLEVDGMTCNHCVSKVTKSVRDVDAVARLDIDLAARKVCVVSDASIDDIAGALEDAGYPARVVDAG